LIFALPIFFLLLVYFVFELQKALDRLQNAITRRGLEKTVSQNAFAALLNSIAERG